jgi:hypothetical protein
MYGMKNGIDGEFDRHPTGLTAELMIPRFLYGNPDYVGDYIDT